MADFTPGPWKFGGRHVDNSVWTEDGRDLIANTHSSQNNFNREEQIATQDANARLIAASPCLFSYVQQKANDGCEVAKKLVRRVSNA